MPLFERPAFYARLLVAIGIWIFAAAALRGQVSNVTDVEATPIPGAGHDYIHMVNETVNPSNGSVSIRIQVPIPQGRGLTLPFSFAYDSNGAIPLGPAGTVPYSSQAGWSYSVPTITAQHWMQKGGGKGDPENCTIYGGYVFADAEATRHAFPQLATLGQGGGQGGDCALLGYGYTLTGGDAWLSAQIASPGNNLGGVGISVTDADGTTYNWTGTGGLVNAVEDRNGNLLKYTSSGNGVFSVTDTAGRTVISSSGFGATGDTVTVSGLAEPYTVTWGETATWNYNLGSDLVYTPANSTCSGWPLTQPNGSSKVVSSISLPNGQSYQFYYDPTYGLLDEIVYPNGGWVKYTWGINTQSEMYAGSATNTSTGNPTFCFHRFNAPAIVKRQVSFDGSTVAQEQDFTYSTTWTDNNNDNSAGLWTAKSTSMTTQDKIRTLSAQTSYSYLPVVIAPPNETAVYVGTQVPVENQTSYRDWNGSVIQTENQTWYNEYLKKSEQTVRPNGSSSISYTYGSLGVVTEKDEVDYGHTTPTRKTLTNYQSFPANPLGAVIHDRPCQVIVEDGSSNRFSETDYFYDNGSTSTVCGTAGTASVTAVSQPTGHDETNYAAASPAHAPRGNVTEKVDWLNSGSSPITAYTYDETGQLLSRTDPCGIVGCVDVPGSNQTLYSYADSYSFGSPPTTTNAYLTKVTDALGHSSSFKYDYADGQVTYATDPNNQSTHSIYNTPPSGCSYSDNLDRLSEIDYPDGGKTTYCYNDAGARVTTSELMNSSNQYKTSVAIGDGIGHVIQTQLSSDPSGTDYVDTAYDGEGNIRTLSNSHRSGTSSTDGTTTFYYDALARPVVQAQPDGAVLQWCYDGVVSTLPSGVTSNCSAHIGSWNAGAWVTSSDENGNQWERTSDSFGRLIQVLEPNGTSKTPSVETDYSYGTLGNLLSLTQWGGPSGTAGSLTRTFGYNSLSQLLSTTNPENGTTTYTYDANGNLATKTDARPVKTLQCYDSVNRLVSKSTSDTTCPSASPYATWTYDQSTVSFSYVSYSAFYPIGRLTSEQSNGASGFSWCAIHSYDPRGRLQWTGDVWGCATTETAIQFFNYDLAGNLIKYTDGNGQFFQYSYNTAGQINTLTTEPAGYPNPTQTTLASSIIYDPLGNTTSINLGNGAQDVQVRNKRGFLTSESLLASPGSGTQLTGWTMAYDPAGNLKTRNDSFVMGNWTYTNDTLNRLSTAVGSLPSPGWGGAWGTQVANTSCQYGYDAFGNRLSQSAASGKQCFNTSVSYTNNRVTNLGYSYDGAGNVTFDGTNTYGYDAEGRVATMSGAGTTASYMYDGSGERVHSIVNGVTTNFAHNPEGRLVWTNQGSLQPHEVYLNGRHFGSIVPNSNQTIKTMSYSIVDHLGTEREQFGASQNVLAMFTSDAFGAALTTLQGTETGAPIHFTGKERDAESGLDYFGARYYGSSMGRFLSPDFNAMGDDLDPVPYADLNNPQSLNLYSYVQNNPLSHKDADGHKCDGGSVGPDGTFTFHCTNDPPPNPNGTVYQLAGALGAGFAPETGGASLGFAAGFVGAMLAAEYLAAHPIHLSSSNEPAPTPPGAAPAAPVPSGLVGTQDGKSGQAGGRHNSGPLDPAHGGSGDAARDFNTLTGGKAGPAPAGSNYPPGTQVGDNGISLRPARGNSGPRIDIPANGDKPHETLHYPN